jgi:hypothetical protein
LSGYLLVMPPPRPRVDLDGNRCEAEGTDVSLGA